MTIETADQEVPERWYSMLLGDDLRCDLQHIGLTDWIPNKVDGIINSVVL